MNKSERILLLIAAIGMIVLVHYGLPYNTHPDEWVIIKDSMKIAYEYSKGNFALTTNLYNHILIICHGFVFAIGYVCRAWDFDGYTLMVSEKNWRILFVFRLVSIVWALLALKICLKIIEQQAFKHHKSPWMFQLFFCCNIVFWNSVCFVKFDPFCAIFYALFIKYFLEIENSRDAISKAILVCWIGLSIRVEFVSFMFVVLLYLFSQIFYGILSIKQVFGQIFKPSLIGVLVYFLGKLPFLNYLVMRSSNSLETSLSFEEALIRRIGHFEIGFYGHAFLFYLLIPTLLIFSNWKVLGHLKWVLISVVLQIIIVGFIDVKHLHYLNMPAFILYFLAIYAVIRSAKNFNYWLCGFQIIVALCCFGLLFVGVYLYKPAALRTEILAQSTQNDTILYLVASDINISESAATLLSRIDALKEKNGYVGIGMYRSLEAAKSNQAETRNLIFLQEDDYWKGTKYENLWTITQDTSIIMSKNPLLILERQIPNPRTKDFQIDLESFMSKYYHQISTYDPIGIGHYKGLFNEYYFFKQTLYRRN